MVEIERSKCTFCDFDSDYVLTVTDPAPEDMQVIDNTVAMPICRPCFEDMKEADMNNMSASASSTNEDRNE